MNRTEMLESTADDYRKEGYEVVCPPQRADLPDTLAHDGATVDIVARKGQERVAVSVRRRDELSNLTAVSEAIDNEPHWRLDVIVFPRFDADDVATDAAEADEAEIRSRIAESASLLDRATLRASFLVAWSAVEAAMRHAARRESLPADRKQPRVLLETLYSSGPLSLQEFELGQRGLAVRDALMHGFRVPSLRPADVSPLLDLARSLLSGDRAAMEQAN